jgi:hypothetical protein
LASKRPAPRLLCSGHDSDTLTVLLVVPKCRLPHKSQNKRCSEMLVAICMSTCHSLENPGNVQPQNITRLMSARQLHVLFVQCAVFKSARIILKLLWSCSLPVKLFDIDIDIKACGIDRDMFSR